MDTSDWPAFLSRPDTLIPALALMVPIVAIIVGGISGVLKMILRHQERMEMIRQGIHPDYPPDEGPAGENGVDSGQGAAGSQKRHVR